MTFLTDAAGVVTDTYAYDAWGNIVAQSGSTQNTRLYTGEEMDSDLGLVNLRARYYSPRRGRFGTSDAFNPGSTLSPLSLNRYLYANSDPGNRRDPRGLFAGVEYGTLVATGPSRVLLSSVAGAGAGAGAIGATAGIGLAVGVAVGEKTSCTYQGIADDFSAIWDEDIIKANPHCPEYLCTCRCPVIDFYYKDLLAQGLIPPLNGKPKDSEKGVGDGLTEYSATVRCFRNAEKQIENASYNEDRYFGTDLAQCTVTECTLR